MWMNVKRDERGKREKGEKVGNVKNIKILNWSFFFSFFKSKFNANLARRSTSLCPFAPRSVCTNISRHRAAWPLPESIPTLFEPRLFQSPRLFPLVQPGNSANRANATWNSAHKREEKTLNEMNLSFHFFRLPLSLLFPFSSSLFVSLSLPIVTPGEITGYTNIREYPHICNGHVFTINTVLSVKTHIIQQTRYPLVVDRANIITIEKYGECGKLNKSPPTVRSNPDCNFV